VLLANALQRTTSMYSASGHIGPFDANGDFGWAVAVAVVMLVSSAFALFAIVGYAVAGGHLPCPLEGRIVASLVVPAATSGCSLGLAAFRSTAGRAMAGILGAIVLGGLTWWIVASMFALQC
jgi:hypothetical protein